MAKQAPRSDRFQGRGGIKLQAALDGFGIDVGGKIAADLGSNVGGFVDCLLRNGAAKVYSVDTSYGALAWRLRQDPRVVVLERHNAMHVRLPEAVDLVTIDVGWTPQEKILPNAMRMVRPGGRIVSLLKPQYEAAEAERDGGVVKPECIERVVTRVVNGLRGMGIPVLNSLESPIKGEGGNTEFFLLIG